MPLGRLALLALAAAALFAGLGGGLVRLGAPIAMPAAAALHGALMVGGFLGTVIGLERAVAAGSWPAYLAPLASGLALAAGLADLPSIAAVLLAGAPWLLLASSAALARRQVALHTVLPCVAALCWAVGNALLVAGAAPLAPAWWFAFLVLTIAAERLELTRLAPRRPMARPLFVAIATALPVAAAIGALDEAIGAIAYGATLLACAAWLAAFDIARRTIRSTGLARYSAACLLAGYAWLAVAGLAWAATPFAPAARDAAIHALGLGFVFSMIFAHAPIVVPVVARLRVRYTPGFYGPLALLHLSLLVRLAPGAFDAGWRLAGGALGAVAIVAFAATLAAALWKGREG